MFVFCVHRPKTTQTARRFSGAGGRGKREDNMNAREKTDFRPTWYHDTSHIPKESHNVYFKKKKKKNDYNHSKKRNRR